MPCHKWQGATSNVSFAPINDPDADQALHGIPVVEPSFGIVVLAERTAEEGWSPGLDNSDVVVAGSSQADMALPLDVSAKPAKKQERCPGFASLGVDRWGMIEELSEERNMLDADFAEARSSRKRRSQW